METEKKHTKRFATGLVFLVVFAAVTVCGFVFHEQLFAEGAWFTSSPTNISLLNTLLALVPKVVASVQVLFITLLAIYIVCTIISKIFKNTPRRITIGKLVNSIVKVVIWVIGVIAVLAVWGVDVAALIAGAGVLTLVIGLGMQSLIADVVAGIFLVCDGTIQVGDMVTIDGWRGTVQEIGIRNTKLINYSGDIRVANNSTIKIFVNQSRENSFPTVAIGIEYSADIKAVEEVFKANRSKIKEMIPSALAEPDYLGVDALGDSSVNLLFGVTCKEDDFFQAQRDLRRALKLVFEENGFSVPFPQIVLHESTPKTK